MNAPSGVAAAALDLVEHAAAGLEAGVRLGRVVDIAEDTALRVDFDGNPHGPLPARIALGPCDAAVLAQVLFSSTVLLVFADGDLRRPVIAGLVSQNLREACERDMHVAPMEPAPPQAAVALQAREELVLQCGLARIVLRADGKVVIAGREVLSRAQERYRIKGGTVSIN